MPPLQQPAIQLIVEDHQALAVVLQALRDAVEHAGRSGRAPDFDELRAMLFYLDEIPARIHQATESELLFPRIRARCPALRPVLDRLEVEHERRESAGRELEHALTAWRVVGEVRRKSFELMARTHFNAYLGHMEVEERDVLPVAVDFLSPGDWHELAEALTRQRNELGGSMAQSHRALFARIKANHPLQK